MYMWIVFSLCIILTLAYVLLLLLYRKGWRLEPFFTVPDDFHPQTKISIIIPARNESANIKACMDAILAQNYPQSLFEIVVVDDHSTDDTAAIVKAYQALNVRCIALADYLQDGQVVNAFKKKALTAGIGQTSGDLVVTTDADCVAPANWLRNIAALHEKENAAMIVAPVDFTCDGSILQLFQSTDFMSMQGITVATNRLKLGNMCNGANLAFSRKTFEEVGGYAGTEHLASGDDYLLMMKMQQRFPGSVSILKTQEAIVRTLPQTSWEGFLQQRIRWASKSGKYDDKRMTAVLMLVYLFNLSFPVLLLFACKPFAVQLLACMLVVKILAELYFLVPVARFFGKQKELIYFPFLQLVHIAYIILAGFLGVIGKYKWKDRSLK